MTKKGLSLFELVTALTIISVFAALLITFINKTAIVGKEKALEAELKSLRLSLVLYKAVKGDYPEDLKAFIETKYKAKGSDEIIFGNEFLKAIGRDSEGYPIDPFGKRFKYSRKDGVISPATKGYENW